MSPAPGRLEIFSPLPPAECAARLASTIDRERSLLFSSTALLGSKPVIGQASESSLRLRKRIRYRNSFQSFLFATMRPQQGGTLISGTFAMHPMVRTFMFVWFGFVAVIGGALTLATVRGTLSSSDGNSHSPMGVIIPVGMLCIGLALIRFGRYLARNEARFISDFLIQTLHGREQEPASESVDS
jgi:hypothetical protein